jgi:hypothetical protein
MCYLVCEMVNLKLGFSTFSGGTLFGLHSSFFDDLLVHMFLPKIDHS